MGTKGPSFEANRGAHRRFCWRVPAIFANGQPVNGYCYAGNGHEWTVSIRIHPKKTYIVVTKNYCIALENRRLDPFAPALLSSMFCTTVVWSFDALSIAWVVELPDIFGLGNQNVLSSLIFPTAKKNVTPLVRNGEKRSGRRPQLQPWCAKFELDGGGKCFTQNRRDTKVPTRVGR